MMRGDLAPLEAGVVLDAETCEGRDLTAPQSRHSSAPGDRKPGRSGVMRARRVVNSRTSGERHGGCPRR